MSGLPSGMDGLGEIEAASSENVLPSAVLSSSQSVEHAVILPVSMNDDGTFVEESVDLSSLLLTKPGGLQDICRRYKNISSTGNKAQLIDRLRDLSANRERWREQFMPGARRKHKGGTTSRKSQLKLSNVRRGELFGQTTATSSQSTTRTRTAAESAELSSFAADIMAQIERESQQATHAHETTTPMPTAPPPGPQLPSHSLNPTTSPIVTLADTQLPLLATMLAQPVANAILPQLAQVLHSLHSQHPARLHGLPAAPQQSMPRTAPGVIVPHLNTALHVPERPQQPPAVNERSTRRRTIRIHGQDLTFQYNQLPDPPALPIEDDVAGLAAHWGDNPTEWHTVKHGTYLRICDTAIPILYWKDVYIGWKGLNDRRWELLKGRWINWRFLVKTFRAAGSNDAFWARYTFDGKRLPITRVMKEIKNVRTARDARIAQFAREYCAEHGENFDELFQYRKGGRMLVQTRDHVIARRWQKLGRPMPPDVSVSSDEGDDEE